MICSQQSKAASSNVQPVAISIDNSKCSRLFILPLPSNFAKANSADICSGLNGKYSSEALPNLVSNSLGQGLLLMLLIFWHCNSPRKHTFLRSLLNFLLSYWQLDIHPLSVWQRHTHL